MDQNVSKYQGFDPPEAHLCGGSVEVNFTVFYCIFWGRAEEAKIATFTLDWP